MKNNLSCNSISFEINPSTLLWKIFCCLFSDSLCNNTLSVISGKPSNSSIKLFPQIILQSRFGNCLGLVCSLNSPFPALSAISSSITIDNHKRNFAISTALGSISQAKIQFLIVLTFNAYGCLS